MCEQGAIPTSIIEDDDTRPLFSNATTMEIPAVPEMVARTERVRCRPASQWSPEALSRLLADVRRS